MKKRKAKIDNIKNKLYDEYTKILNTIENQRDLEINEYKEKRQNEYNDLKKKYKVQLIKMNSDMGNSIGELLY